MNDPSRQTIGSASVALAMDREPITIAPSVPGATKDAILVTKADNNHNDDRIIEAMVEGET
jgi:hypothetical protein